MKMENNLSLERCPHCSVDKPNLPQQWQTSTANHSGRNERTWKVYRCLNCGGLILASSPKNTLQINAIYPERSMETFEFDYLEGDVLEDFTEALKCFSYGCYNAFASMCRRTIQTAAENLKVKGKDKVKKQILELKDLLNIDDETFEVLNQIIITGHDGAHPHLPKLNPERAAVLLELMKDVLYQLFIRKKKIEESVLLRQKSIKETNNT